MNIASQKIGEKAQKITALQRGYTSWGDERKITDILCGTQGEALTALKLQIDHGEDHLDLLELLYHDIDDLDLRSKIVNHFRANSMKVDPGKRRVRILSDIDDTLYASLNDPTYVRGTLYPGITTFHEELAREARYLESNVTDLVLLTARPRDGLGLVERFTKQALSKQGMENTVILSGSLPALRSHEAMALKKLENFTRYSDLYPEFDFVFIGDSGQGDTTLGELMLGSHSDRVRSILIHNLDGGTLSSRKVTAFQTYLGAANELYREGLLRKEACHKIARAVRDDLARAQYCNPEQRKRVLGAYLIDSTQLPLFR
jgi:uncharacterized protein DUF2183